MSTFVLPRALPTTSANFGEGTTNELCCAHPSASVIERAAHGALRISHRVAQRCQRADRIFRGRPFTAGRGHTTRDYNLHVIELIREVEDQLLSLLASNPGYALQRRDVPLPNGAHEPLGR